MINKELSEILDALTRESGESMLPYQELEILGFSPLGKSDQKRLSMCNDDDDDEFIPEEAEDDEIDYDDDDYNESNVDEEYEFDEDDEEYSLLIQVLRLNNCRKKYFA